MKTETNNACLVDTNILVYASVKSAGKKHKLSLALVEDYFLSDDDSPIAIQTLGEFFNVINSKYHEKKSAEACDNIIRGFLEINNIIKLGYKEKELLKAMELAQTYNKHFWDCLIAATMLENNVYTIYTENIRDFEGLPGIKAVNPFIKKLSTKKN